MIKALKALFAGTEEKTGADEEITAELAAAALMVEAAMSDGVYANVEHDEIIKVLIASFKLDAEAAEAVLNKAEDLADRAVDHHRFTKVVKMLDHDRRMQIMTDLWRVALADGERDAHEDMLLRRLAPLLALSDRERAEARQAAERDAQAR